MEKKGQMPERMIAWGGVGGNAPHGTVQGYFWDFICVSINTLSDTLLQEGQSLMQYDLHIDQYFHLKRNHEIKKSRIHQITKSRNQEIKIH